VGGMRDPLAPHMSKGEDCSKGRALPLAVEVKVESFATSLEKTKEGSVSGYSTAPCR